MIKLLTILSEIQIIKGPTPEMVKQLNDELCSEYNGKKIALSEWDKIRTEYKSKTNPFYKQLNPIHNNGRWSIECIKLWPQSLLNEIFPIQLKLKAKYNI